MKAFMEAMLAIRKATDDYENQILHGEPGTITRIIAGRRQRLSMIVMSATDAVTGVLAARTAP